MNTDQHISENAPEPGLSGGRLRTAIISAIRELNEPHDINQEYLRGQVELAASLIGYEDDSTELLEELERAVYEIKEGQFESLPIGSIVEDDSGNQWTLCKTPDDDRILVANIDNEYAHHLRGGRALLFASLPVTYAGAVLSVSQLKNLPEGTIVYDSVALKWIASDSDEFILAGTSRVTSAEKLHKSMAPIRRMVDQRR